MKSIKINEHYKLGVMSLFDLFSKYGKLEDYEELMSGNSVVVSDEMFDEIKKMPNNYLEALEIENINSNLEDDDDK